MSALIRNNVKTKGNGPRAMVFAHGYGCDQTMWRHVAPAFEDRFTTVLFDQIGTGGSDLSAYDRSKYGHLSGYSQDLAEICAELGVREAVFVGHSVSAMIGVLASIADPGLFAKLVLVGPSPRYLDEHDYVGGFSARQVDDFLDFLANNYMVWASAMAPAIMGNPERPELGEELAASFCRMDPQIAKDFARVTFTSDNRDDLAKVSVPTLILQCSDDIIAPVEVGKYVHGHITGSTFVQLRAAGHCPNLSAPDEVVEAIRNFV